MNQYEYRAYLMDTKSAISDPLSKAALTGFFSGGFWGSLSWYLNDPNALKHFSLGFFTLGLPAWLWGLVIWGTEIEKIDKVPADTATNNDVRIVKKSDRVPIIQYTQTAPAPAVIRAEEKVTPSHTRRHRFPMTENQLKFFHRTIVDYGYKPTEEVLVVGAPFSRNQLNTLRDYLIKKNLADWNSPGSPTQGWDLTSRGRSAIRQLYRNYFQPPSPTREHPQKTDPLRTNVRRTNERTSKSL